MLYTEDSSMHHYVGFSQIRSQIGKQIFICCLQGCLVDKIFNLQYTIFANFRASCTHFKSSKWGSGCQSTKISIILSENTVILLLLIIKNISKPDMKPCKQTHISSLWIKLSTSYLPYIYKLAHMCIHICRHDINICKLTSFAFISFFHSTFE